MSPLAIGCRQCAEQAGQPCRNPDGVQLVYFHRIRVADAAAKEDQSGNAIHVEAEG